MLRYFHRRYLSIFYYEWRHSWVQLSGRENNSGSTLHQRFGAVTPSYPFRYHIYFPCHLQRVSLPGHCLRWLTMQSSQKKQLQLQEDRIVCYWCHHSRYLGYSWKKEKAAMKDAELLASLTANSRPVKKVAVTKLVAWCSSKRIRQHST